MGIRIQKRINLGGGFGLNISKKGVSTSFRGKGGSISNKGYSIRTGISGVSYRGSFGKSNNGCLFIMVLIIGIMSLFSLFL